MLKKEVKPDRKWQPVPEASQDLWGKAFSSGCDVKVLGPCPFCKMGGLRRYWGGGGVHGALWQWCVWCRTYEHASGQVPEKWVKPDLVGVEEKKLTVYPDGLVEPVEVWLENQLEQKLSTLRVMEDLFTQEHAFLKEGDYEACDVLLQEFDVTEYPPIVAVGLLRGAFAAKSKLPAWDGLLGRTQVRIQSLGGDSERLLRGLV